MERNVGAVARLPVWPAIRASTAASSLMTLLSGALIARVLVEFEVYSTLGTCFGVFVINTCLMDLIIVAIGVLIFCLRSLSMFEITKNFHYNQFKCSFLTSGLLAVTPLSIVYAVASFFVVRAYWTAQLHPVIQFLHLFPSAAVILEVLLQGAYLVCRLSDERRREQPVIEQSLGQILWSSNVMFVLYALTMLAVVINRTDPHFVLEVVVISLELVARAFVLIVLRQEFFSPALRPAAAPLPAPAEAVDRAAGDALVHGNLTQLPLLTRTGVAISNPLEFEQHRGQHHVYIDTASTLIPCLSECDLLLVPHSTHVYGPAYGKQCHVYAVTELYHPRNEQAVECSGPDETARLVTHNKQLRRQARTTASQTLQHTHLLPSSVKVFVNYRYI